MKKNIVFIMVSALSLFLTYGLQAQTILEAEDASHGLSVKNSGAASGGQYLEMGASGSIVWTFNSTTGGNQNLSIWFSSPFGPKKQNALLNGQSIGELDFSQSSSFVETTISANLNVGSNTFEIQKSWGWMNFDALVVPSATSNEAPTASFDYSPKPVFTGENVNFTGGSSSDSDGNIVNYAWDFGDGGSGSSVNASHTYSTAGNYQVTLTVTDDGGLTGTKTKTVSVSPSDNPVVKGVSEAEDANHSLTVMSDTGASNGQYLEMSASGSVTWTFESNGGTQEIKVIFRAPHGAKEQFISVNGESQGKVSFAETTTFSEKSLTYFLLEGTNTLSISAEWGFMDLDAIVTEPVTGINVAFNHTPSNIIVAESATFNGSISTDDDGSIVNHSWDFGDGSHASGAIVNHSYSNAGTYNVTLMVEDNDGNVGSLTQAMEVFTGVPVARFGATPSIPRPGEMVQFNASGSFDPNGNINNYSWNFGDGNMGSGVNPTHVYSNEGSTMVSLTVTDNEGNSTSTTQALTVGSLKRPIDPNATLGTTKLYTSLDSVAQSNQIIFGAQETTRYGTEFVYQPGQQIQSDVQIVTGDFPGVYGWEIGVDDLGVFSNPLDNPILSELIVEAYNRGGVNTIAWHMPNPAGGTSWDNTSGDACHRILPGNNLHDVLLAHLDKFADFAKGLIGADGSVVPIVFRPWHEHNGDWFWWGSQGCSASDYVALWQFTVEYLRETKNVHNLLYSFSPDASRTGGLLYRFPGDDYVDIMGLDNYWHLNNNMQQEFIDTITEVASLAEQKNKVAALTETGHDYGTGCDSSWYSNLLSGIKSKPNQASGLAYVLVWRNANFATENRWHYYVPKSTDDCDAAGFKAFYDDPMSLFHADLPEMY